MFGFDPVAFGCVCKNFFSLRISFFSLVFIPLMSKRMKGLETGNKPKDFNPRKPKILIVTKYFSVGGRISIDFWRFVILGTWINWKEAKNLPQFFWFSNYFLISFEKIMNLPYSSSCHFGRGISFSCKDIQFSIRPF